ncbi:Holliday junction resolvase RecU [Mycoplasmopsis verecunda]|uniref:Holliday junction resolvase RecU n=1 Tax=Mycoplasmopsis verecunda TaxID=171291 RepID=A0A1T4L6Q2_9BACT|nr:Holliday junction resolvase RecU [Mycoplasmopsis verecunda]WPB54776.1 Holliday junction resolvase RecU [Mycoplasmopsis verecunda]SJZ50402.1 recombination protein U [Mycoplasmopsis verecunda]
MNNKNKGMFLETIINQTINYYWNENIAYIEKKSVPIEINNIKRKSSHTFVGSFSLRKSTVDYIGMYKGQFICFEAKSTNENKLEYQNFRPHQLSYLRLISNNGGIAFVIVYFALYNEFYKLSIQFLDQHFAYAKNIKYEEIKKNSRPMILEFPGYLNIFN